jgi:hypothetical protein
MKSLLVSIVGGFLLVGCGGSQQSAPVPETQPTERVAKELAQQPASLEEAQLLIWENAGDGIEIDNDGKTMVRRAKNEKPYCGSMSKYPIPSDKLITLRIDSSSGRMFCYVGLTSNDVDVNKWSGKRPENWCLYFSDGKNWSGMHDSVYAKKNNSSDYRNKVVPVIKSSETISLIYSPSSKKITFYRDDKNIYVGNGFEGDLYLFGAVRNPDEPVTILE